MRNYFWKIFRPPRLVKIVTVLLFTLLLVYMNTTQEHHGYTKDTHRRDGYNNDTHCIEDVLTGNRMCRPVCQRGFFSLPGMEFCHPLLKCDAIKNEVKPLERIGKGFAGIKKLTVATWKNHNVVMNEIQLDNYYRHTNVFLLGLDNLRNLQPSEKVVQLIGTCGSIYLTEYHPLGSAERYEKRLLSPAIQNHNNIRTRLTTCISYIEAINFLHNSPIGTRVFCDSSTPLKAMSQFLITADLRLIINDVDEIPEVNRETNLTTTCRFAEEKFAYFIAPEMLEKNRKDIGVYTKHLSGYDEKTDIWKIPAICEYFFGSEKTKVMEHLSHINAKCKNEKPSLRPTASEVLKAYKAVLNIISDT